MCMMTGLVGTSAAIRMTERICSTVPGLNTTWLMPTLVQLVDQRDGLFEFGDARADDDAVDRGAGLARLLHQPLAADLKLPQVRVEEQRVELDGAARLEQLRSARRCGSRRSPR